MIDYLPSNHATAIIIQLNSTNTDTIITFKSPLTNMIRDFRPQPTESPDKSFIVDISNDEESGGQIPPEVNNIVPTSDDVDNPRQSSDSPNNNARKASDEIQPLTKGLTGGGQSRADNNDEPRQSTEEEKQKFDKYVGESALVIALSFVGTSVILHTNLMTVNDHYPTLVDVQSFLNFVTFFTGVSLLFLSMIKLPNPRTARYQFTLMVLGFVFIILCVAIRTFVALSPEISKERTIGVVSLMIGSTGFFVVYVWSAARQTEDNRQSSANR